MVEDFSFIKVVNYYVLILTTTKKVIATLC